MAGTTRKTDPQQTSSAPLQRQVRDRLAALILDGTLAPGSALPPLRELAAQLGTSVTPLQRALKDLADAGMVEVRPGRGNGARVLGPPSAAGGEGAAAAAAPLAVIARTSPHYDANRWKHRMVTALEQELGVLTGGARRILFYNQVEADGTTLIDPEDVLACALESRPAAVAFVELGGLDAARLETLWGMLEKAAVPGVFVSGSAMRAPVHSVYYDNDWAGYLAARFLCEQGHRTLATPVFPADAWGDETEAEGGEWHWMAERLGGIERACRLYGARLYPLVLRPEDGPGMRLADWAGWGDVAADRLRAARRAPGGAADPAPTALIATNDQMAMRAIAALTREGTRVPEDVYVLGFDNEEAGRAYQLTTVEPPIEEMGREAARLLERLLATRAPGGGGGGGGADAPVQHILVKPALIVRALRPTTLPNPRTAAANAAAAAAGAPSPGATAALLGPVIARATAVGARRRADTSASTATTTTRPREE